MECLQPPFCQTSPTHCHLQLAINAMWHIGSHEQMLLQWSIMGMANNTYTRVLLHTRKWLDADTRH